LTTLSVRAPRFLVAAAAAVFLSGCGINNIPTYDEQAKAEFADLQAAYQRRADLIPNLVATVQGAAAQERTTLREVIEARSRATSIQVTPETINDPQAMARFQAAQDQLSGALSRLLVVSENYPQLQSNQNFLALQNELERTENRINIARQDYNESARRLNTEMRTFPGSIWAGTVHKGVEPARPFQASAAAQEAPRVQFNNPGAPPPAPTVAPPAQ
jgi:LemA protein